MSERYSRLYALPGNLYAETSPVVIAAGALLKDNETGNVLAQLKLKSISNKNIKAVTVSISAFDTFDAPLGEAVSYQYLDMNAARDAEFGAKKAIFLPDATTRKFSAAVTSVAFADNSAWKASGALWEPLPAAKALETMLDNDHELWVQYRIKNGRECNYVPEAHGDLWYCACGALNHQEEANCHSCGRSFAQLRSVDLQQLRTERDERLAAEAKKAAEEKAAAEARERERKAAAEARAKAEKAAAETAKAKRRKIGILFGIAAVIVIVVLITRISPNSRYNNAVKLMENGQYEKAIAAFEAMEGYKDSAEQLITCEYYAAVALIDNGDVIKAYEALMALDGYKDSAEKASAIYGTYKLAKLKTAEVGDYVLFGSYEQDNTTSNGKEEIEWLVLEIQNDKALLISRYALDSKPYNETFEDVTWENCTLRKWLNSNFFNAAFSAAEQSMIPSVTVSAGKKSYYGTEPSKATQDKVFLLSVTEADKYFASDSARICRPTDYAVANGAYVKSDNSNCWWRLRSSGYYYPNYAALVGRDGSINDFGYEVNFDGGAVRPALWVDLDS